MDERILAALAVMLAVVILLQITRLPLRAVAGGKSVGTQMGCVAIVCIPIVLMGLALEAYFLFIR